MECSGWKTHGQKPQMKRMKWKGKNTNEVFGYKCRHDEISNRCQSKIPSLNKSQQNTTSQRLWVAWLNCFSWCIHYAWRQNILYNSANIWIYLINCYTNLFIFLCSVPLQFYLQTWLYVDKKSFSFVGVETVTGILSAYMKLMMGQIWTFIPSNKNVWNGGTWSASICFT